MANNTFEVESSRLFSKSLIWQLNRDYYQKESIDAWRNNVVPHHMTSNSTVGKTYAELILGLLRDLSFKNQQIDKVYILELGTGHGRLAYHILKHLEKLRNDLNIELPPYCYVVSDIVEESLSFYQEHPQFKTFFEQGLLDFCYFDAMDSTELVLRHSNIKISKQDLNQPIVVISNYFFDSIPTDLFHIQNKEVSACSISLHSEENPKDMQEKQLIDHLTLIFQKKVLEKPFYKEALYNELLDDYKEALLNSYLFFPEKSFQCLSNIRALSKEGMLVLSMDKGFHELLDLQDKKEPELITHGSFSIWVNFHALGQYCQKLGGKFIFPSYSTFYSQVACLMFLSNAESYKEIKASYLDHIDRFGPDDFNSIKRLTYNNISKLTLKDLIALIRLSDYDSTFFNKILPRIRQVSHHITKNERKRLGETMHEVWDMYFTINEHTDLAYELGGTFYDLGFYREALVYFDHSIESFGQQADVCYNQALCYYQLREDAAFIKMKEEGKRLFPTYKQMEHLDKLDLSQA